MVDVKAGDFVLVRDSSSQVWRKRVFCRQRPDSRFPYVCEGVKGGTIAFRYMIPFEGNENLVDRGADEIQVLRYNYCRGKHVDDDPYRPHFCPRSGGYWGC